MACREFEHLIALNVEGDLSPADRRCVDLHLRACSDCWDLAEDLKESQAVFKSIRRNTPDQAMLLNVRARVLAEAGVEHLSWFERIFLGGFRQKATLAAMAVFVIVLGFVWISRGRDTRQTPVAVVPAPPVSPATTVEPLQPKPVPVVAVAKPKVRRPKPASRVEAPDEPVKQVAIKLLTDDPNVIIYWLVDEQGE